MKRSVIIKLISIPITIVVSLLIEGTLFILFKSALDGSQYFESLHTLSFTTYVFILPLAIAFAISGSAILGFYRTQSFLKKNLFILLTTLPFSLSFLYQYCSGFKFPIDKGFVVFTCSATIAFLFQLLFLDRYLPPPIGKRNILNFLLGIVSFPFVFYGTTLLVIGILAIAEILHLY